MDLWEKLHLITTFECKAQCRRLPPSFEPRHGSGIVKIQEQTDDTLTFFEKGKWQGVHSKQETLFTNVFRFSKKERGVITLEHFQLGKERPQMLFTLTAIEPHLYKTLSPQETEEDTHVGSVLFDTHFVHLSWHRTGPEKNQLLSIVYS